MSYLNGRLPAPSSSTISESIRGLPGVGFKLTDDGDYDIENKKLRNVAEPESNDDSSTKRYVDTEVSKTLKKDGTDQMSGLLDMDYNKIQNVGPGSPGKADALTHIYLESFYFNLNTDILKLKIRLICKTKK